MNRRWMAGVLRTQYGVIAKMTSDGTCYGSMAGRRISGNPGLIFSLKS